jgi:hypothetical protein
LALSVVLGGVQSAHAVTTLYWEDATHGTSAVPGALDSLGLTGSTITATDALDFQTRLAGGTWDLVIFGEQDSEVFPSLAADLGTYLAGGGKILGTTWVAGGYATFMEATQASTNGLTITTDSHPTFAGLGNSIGLSNPDPVWATFSQGYNPIGGGVCIGSIDSGGCAAILGNAGHTLLLAPLFDTYAPPADGELLVANSITYLLAPVPEPSTLALLSAGLAFAGINLIRRRLV